MNMIKARQRNVIKVVATAALVSFLLVNCATTPQSPQGAAEVRAKLTNLKSDPNLGSRAPIEIREAEAAVELAEVPVPKDPSLGAYRVYMADYKVQIARAKATTRFAEDQRVQLSEEREQARLLARTREADLARSDAEMSRRDANRARDDADAARVSEANAAADAAQRAEWARKESDREREAAAAEAAYQADLARNDAAKQAEAAQNEINQARTETDKARALAAANAADAADAAKRAEAAQNEIDQARSDADKARALATANAADAARQQEELQRQINLLEARTTDRGLVLTLGNVLFATGKADLKSGATATLNKLVSFLNQYPDRNVVIEGHTDNVGTSSSNQLLSQRRAESVSAYLSGHGISAQRLSTAGMGEDQPIAENDSETGRQQNRRVEIIIDNPPLVATALLNGE